ncbi:hypothetical protein GCM10009801_66900 [Streptomyces albiaxialis]|uniref:N-acetyltransferase domain-containing protein n=1 Tax=Streptomyces albiaxialis TaxID=329523 RepID=A0ABN2WQ65_9ACTN
MTEVRAAVEDDIAELVRLRALLFETLGGDFFNPGSADPSWRVTCAAVFKEQLAHDGTRILVVDGTDSTDDTGGSDGLAACVIGTTELRVPSPHLPRGRVGNVIGVVTDPAYRRRGHSRALMRELLDWFRAYGVDRVDLHASRESEPLYRALGFADHPDPSLYWHP